MIQVRFAVFDNFFLISKRYYNIEVGNIPSDINYYNLTGYMPETSRLFEEILYVPGAAGTDYLKCSDKEKNIECYYNMRSCEYFATDKTLTVPYRW